MTIASGGLRPGGHGLRLGPGQSLDQLRAPPRRGPASPATASSSTPLTTTSGANPAARNRPSAGRRGRREDEPAGRRHRTSVPVPATHRNTPEPVAGYLDHHRRGSAHAERRPSGAGPDEVDRRQGLDDRPPRRLRAPGRVARRAGHVLPGAVLRPLLLPGPGRGVLRLRRAGARRADHPGDDGARPGARDGARRPDLRAGAGGPALQHGGGHRRRRHLSRQVPEDPPPAGEGLLGEVLLPAREPRVPGVRHRRRPHRRLHLLRPPLPRGVAGPRPGGGEDRVQPVGHLAWPRAPTSGSSSSPPRRWPTSTTSAPSTGWGSSRSATTTSTARPTSSSPRGQFVGEVASTTDEELVVRDLDMDLDRRGPQPVGVLPGPSSRHVRPAHPGRRRTRWREP